MHGQHLADALGQRLTLAALGRGGGKLFVLLEELLDLGLVTHQ
jgi:hypothetical protein